MHKFLERTDRALNVALSVFVIVSFASMVLLVIAQVYTRFFTLSSLTWSEELSRYFMVYMIFFSAVLVAREKGHLRIENAISKLPAVGAKVADVISLILQIVFFSIVMWGAIEFYPTAMMRTSPANGIPMHIVYLCVPVSCGLMILYCIKDLASIFVKGEPK